MRLFQDLTMNWGQSDHARVRVDRSDHKFRGYQLDPRTSLFSISLPQAMPTFEHLVLSFGLKGRKV